MLTNTTDVALTVAPVLLMGLIISGLLKSYVSDRLIQKHLAGKGIGSIIKAALVGMPLPLCSCGVIPVALGLRKKGASKGATSSFLVSTPETGVDSIMVSFALLGPLFAIIRPIAALVSALSAGLLVEYTAKGDNGSEENPVTPCCCMNKDEEKTEGSEGDTTTKSWFSRLYQGQKYAMTTLYDDTFTWLFIGIVAAGAILTWVPTGYFAEFGGTIWSMLLIMLISIPMYTCATASTPIAAGLMAMGISPGAALVFLLAGPATNVATLGVISKELGRRALIGYLAAIAVCALLAGLITNELFTNLGIDAVSHIHHGEHLIPRSVAWITLIILILFQKHVRRLWSLPLFRQNEPKAPKKCCSKSQ